ncbi:MAG: hypothetical protein L0219_07995 [Phycisphaerales bacterium]|nr:hypothetical protein [Phycisphaerales bacterium]
MLLVKQRHEQMLDVHLLMVKLGRQPMGRAESFLGFLGEAVVVHDEPSV